MYRIASFVLTTVAAQEVIGTCGDDSHGPVDDCANIDFGTCGNACCKLDFKVSGNTDFVKDTLNKTLADGGPDGFYELQVTDQGTLGFGDLKQFGSPMGADWIGHVFHTCSGPKHYVDTVNFNIKQISDDVSKVRAFSTSQVGGAFGDSGQNYKNIMMAMKAAFGSEFTSEFVDASCPAASVSV